MEQSNASVRQKIIDFAGKGVNPFSFDWTLHFSIKESEKWDARR